MPAPTSPTSTASPGLLNTRLYIPELDVTYIPIGKCGTSSVIAALQAYETLPVEEAKGRAVAMLRPPLERAWSSWKWFQCQFKPHGGWYPKAEQPFSEWLYALVQHPEPASWATELKPQALHIPPKCYCVRWDWEELSDILQVELPHFNPTEPSAPPQGAEPLVRQIYALDYALYFARPTSAKSEEKRGKREE